MSAVYDCRCYAQNSGKGDRDPDSPIGEVRHIIIPDLLKAETMSGSRKSKENGSDEGEEVREEIAACIQVWLRSCRRTTQSEAVPANGL